MPSVFAALDVTLRRIGGAPAYVLTGNEKTVTTGHVAGIAVRNPQMVAFARHYGVTVHTCEPADPASKGGCNGCNIAGILRACRPTVAVRHPRLSLYRMASFDSEEIVEKQSR
jgi:hypothetical protein